MSVKLNQFWQFRNSADGDSAELLFYGPISEYSWWGDEITPKQFTDDLAALGDIKNLKVRINSPGGDVFAAAAIHNALKNHKATVTAYVDGLAASAASVVAMAADNVVMPKTAMMMIHNPAAVAWGDAREMRDMAEILDKVRDTIIASYEAKTGLDRTKLINLLNAETWMTAQEAKDLGFADEIDEQIAVSASVRGNLLIVNGLGFGLDKFKTIPAAFAADRKEVNEPMAKPIKNEAGDEIAEPIAAEEAEEVIAAPEVEPAAAEAETEAAPQASAEVLAERQRISDIQALAQAGAEEIISNGIKSGASVADVALEICRSEKVRNAATLQARKSDSPHVGADGSMQSGSGTEKDRKVGLLTAALHKVRGIKPEK